MRGKAALVHVSRWRCRSVLWSGPFFSNWGWGLFYINPRSSNRDHLCSPIRCCAFVLSRLEPHREQQSLHCLCLPLALPRHSQIAAEQVERASWQLLSQTPHGPMARLNLLSSSNKFRPAAPPLSPGVPQTEPREGKIIKDILCQEHLSGGSLAVPTGEGWKREEQNKKQREKAIEAGRARVQVSFSCASPAASPAPLSLLLN